MLRVRGLFLPIRTLALLLSEILVMSVAFYLFVAPVDGHVVEAVQPFGVSTQFALVLVVLTVLTMVAVGLYNHDAFLDYRSMLARIVLAIALEGPVIFAASLVYRDFVWSAIPAWSAWYLKVIFALFASLLITRALFLLLADTGAWKRRVVVIGTGDRAARIKQISDRPIGAHFIPAAFIAYAKDQRRIEACAFVLDETVDAEQLYRLARECGAREIVVAPDDRRGLPVRPLLGCKARGLAITEFLSFCERETGRVDLDALRPSWLVFSDGFRMNLFARSLKRIFDIAVSAAMLLLTLPLLLLTALFIKLEDRGPILYTQERVGLFDRPFTLYKFRSMRVNAERNGEPQWAAQNDQRITRVGALIRRVRIDELPQLINVLKGEMSFVGPRPERPYFVEQLVPEIPFYGERHAVKPGITGWAQINHPYGASLNDARQKLSYDLFYVKNHSLLLDFIILIQTVRVILFSEGAR
jgi:sugar transferase (PEP-CTERM system associated)